MSGQLSKPSPLNELCSALPSLPMRLQQVGRFVAANDYDATTRSMRELAVVAGADDDSSDDTAAVVAGAAAVVAGACSADVALPALSSSSPHAAAINARPAARAAIRFVRLLITWILLIEFRGRCVCHSGGAGHVFTLLALKVDGR